MIGRIRERRAFERLARSGRRAGTAELWCRYLPDPAADPPAVAFALPRSTGTAVERNRLRRRLRAVLDEQARLGSLPAGWWLVGSRTLAAWTFAELRADVTALIRRVAS